MTTAQAPNRRDHGLGLLLCVGYIAVLLHTAGAIGMSRDESMYVAAADSYGRWIKTLFTSPSDALRPEIIDRDWRINNEHPALVKTLFALSRLAHERWHIFSTDSLSYRFPGMLTAGLLLWLIYIMGVRLYGRRAGLFAALAYALLPRPFYHSHLDCFDVPITLAVTYVVYAYWRSLTSKVWAVGAGFAFGLALATKHNSWVLPGIFAIHLLWMAMHKPSVSRVPYALLAMLTIGPLVFWGSWPWLWHDTLPRLNAYARFHLHHDYYNIEYFGVNYFWPPFPISYPFALTLFTVPVTTLLLAIAGFVLEARRYLSARQRPVGDTDHSYVLWMGCLLAPLVIIALPSTPIFGGTKHWFTAYPFMVLFAGAAFERMRAGLVTSALAGAVLLLPSFVETAHSHPFGLSHYGLAAGGVPGAADLGMNRQFWGFTTRSLVGYFNAQMPKGGSVYICDTTGLAFQMLVRDGLLPANIRPSGDIAFADYAIVHHEKHFFDVEAQIWSLYGTSTPVHVLRYDGVPIISVYKNPRASASR